MTGLTEYITTARWADTMLIWLVLIDDAYQALETEYGRWRQRGPAPSCTDSEIITVSVIIDTFFGGNEELGLAFVRQYHRDCFPTLPPNGQFNDRRRTLRLIIEQVRRVILPIAQGPGGGQGIDCARPHNDHAPHGRSRAYEGRCLDVAAYL